MKVIYCGGLDWCKYAPDHLGIKQGMTELGWEWSVVDSILGDPSGEEIAGQINDINPDLVIHGNTDSLTKSVCPLVRKGISQVFWMLDYRTPKMLTESMWYGWTKNGPYLDAIFISARDHMELWSDAFGVRTLFAPHACYVPDRLEYSKSHAHDILFIGVRHNNPPFNARTLLLSEIQRQVRIPITFINEVDWRKRDIVWKSMNKYYWSSKVVLDISHFWDSPGYCSGRYWYTATYGACSVTRWFPGCEQFFPEGRKWYFETSREAVGAIHYLLHNDGLRERTKERVKNHAWTYHTYAIRFTEMINDLEGLKS